MSKGITMHTKPGCKYCDMAKLFLKEKNIPFSTIHYDPLLPSYENLKLELMNQTKHYSFPQIYIGDVFIGGYTELIRSYETCSLHDLCKDIGIVVEYEF